MAIDNQELIDKIMVLVLKDANERRESAGYSGSWTDGGAGYLEDQVKFFKYGMDSQLPPEWGSTRSYWTRSTWSISD